MSGEQSMMSLFGNDSTSFLEELTGSSAPQAVPITDAVPMIGSNSNDNTIQPFHNSQQPNTNVMNSFSEYNQYSSNTMMSPQQQQTQQQYGSPPSSSSSMTSPTSFASYNIHGSPRVQNSTQITSNRTMWNQSQISSQMDSMYANQRHAYPGQQGYMSRREYPGMGSVNSNPQISSNYPGYPTNNHMRYNPSSQMTSPVPRAVTRQPMVSPGSIMNHPRAMGGTDQFVGANHMQQQQMDPYAHQQKMQHYNYSMNNTSHHNMGMSHSNQMSSYANNGPPSQHQMYMGTQMPQSQSVPTSQGSFGPPHQQPFGPNPRTLGPIPAMDMEIQQLQQQIQQLYSMPQTPQSQQKMLDIQEKMRSLKAQQQQYILQQQRQMSAQNQANVQPGLSSPAPVSTTPTLKTSPLSLHSNSSTTDPKVSPSMRMKQDSTNEPASALTVSTSEPHPTSHTVSTTTVTHPPVQSTAVSQQHAKLQTAVQDAKTNAMQMSPAQQLSLSTSTPLNQNSSTAPTVQQMTNSSQIQANASQMQPNVRPVTPTVQQMPQTAQPILSNNMPSSNVMCFNGNVRQAPQKQQTNTQGPQPLFNQQGPRPRAMNVAPVAEHQMMTATRPVTLAAAVQAPISVGQSQMPIPPHDIQTVSGNSSVQNGSNDQQMDVTVGPQVQQNLVTDISGTSSTSVEEPSVEESNTGENTNKESTAEKHQQKANQIVQEAIARAQAQGLPVPNVMEPVDVPQQTPKNKKKKKADGSSTGRKRTRSKKPKIEVKVTTPTLAPLPLLEEKQSPAASGTTKKETRTKKAQEQKSTAENEAPEQEQSEQEKVAEKGDKKKPTKGEKKSKTPAKPRLKPQIKKRKLPPATFIKSKKKRKRLDDSEGSDTELKERFGTPPPSPDEKRRSTRNTQRKKYLDDIDLNLSDDEHKLALEHHPEGVAEIRTDVQFEERIVEKILGMRQGKREIVIDGDQEEEEKDMIAKTSKSEKQKPTKKKKQKSDKHSKKLLSVEDESKDVGTTDYKSAQDDPSKVLGKNDAEKSTTNDNVTEEVNDTDVKAATLVKKESSTENDVKEDIVNKSEEAADKDGEKVTDEHEKKSGNEMVSDIVKTEGVVEEHSVDTKITTDECLNNKAEPKTEEENSDGSAMKKEPQSGESVEEDTKASKKSEHLSVDIKREAHDEEAKQKIKDEEPEEKPKPVVTETVEVEEFYVKYKNYSYLHCEWKTVEELELLDKRIQGKVKRYKLKRSQAIDSYLTEADDDEYFNPDYVEVDRVLAESIVPADPDIEGSVEMKHYLVKWCALAYEDATWELEVDVNPEKIKQYQRFIELPPEEDRQVLARPLVKDWKKIDDLKEYKNGNKLREYQLEGVNWLTFCYYNKQNCILADEMGLGKTIQSITFLQEVYNSGIKGPYLVIVPLSTLGNWQREFETWTDMNVIVYHGSNPSRNMLQEYEMYYRDENNEKIPNLFRFSALITTYEMIITDFELLSAIDWRVCIIDEAHRLKNKKCKLMEGLDYFELEHRVLLTGTPLQNNVEELFSLLNFLEPKQFTSSDAFMSDFGNLKSEGQVDKLKALLKPMMLRRLKEDVEKSLAPKEETIVEVELTNIQKKYYRAILEKNFSFLSKGTTSNSSLPSLMNTMMELRKCCNHPYLINGAEEQILLESQPSVNLNQSDSERLLTTMVQSSGKLVLVDKLLPKLKAGNHKVLIFSQMIRVLDIIEDYLLQKKYLYERLDGRIRGTTRQEAIDRFSKPDSDRFAFLLCTRAGGLGINLTAADTVIIYDSDWNPQNDLQAQARCHRIGQEKSVKIYRLITRNTYEREMFDKASLKLGLDKAVLQNMNAKNEGATAGSTGLTKKEVEDLLKRGAYGAVMEDGDGGDDFCEEDIDQILQRRTQVITLEAGEKGSTFAKASFSTTATRSDIDIDDPDFWEKWAKKADIDVEQMNSKNDLIIEMPRRRRQTSRYGGHPDQMMEISDLESSDTDEDDDEGTNETTEQPAKPGRKKKGRKSKGASADPLDIDNYSDEEMSTAVLYNRSDFFKVEKLLLAYGWGRWTDILANGAYKRNMKEHHIETMSRALIIYSLRYYKGDDKIKAFIIDLVRPVKEGEERSHKNHKGLSAPVPRGRKGRNRKRDKDATPEPRQPTPTPTEDVVDLDKDLAEIDLDPETIIKDEGYKKHLRRHSNKILLRVRTLYYVKQELIGDQADAILGDASYKDVTIPLITIRSDIEAPTAWWDEDADKSLLIGIFKHGYEQYSMMRQDPALCFLSLCGPPPPNAKEPVKDLDNDIDDESKMSNGDDDGTNATASGGAGDQDSSEKCAEDGNKLPFPADSDLNTRIRKMISAYQHNHKREIINQELMNRMVDRKERLNEVCKEREMKKKEMQQARWSRREESDFYRVVSTFGVERDRNTKEFSWGTFRTLAKLDKKYDDSLTEYFKAFYFMCQKVCKKLKPEDEEAYTSELFVEPISEERAARCLARIDLLNKVREEILWHPRLDERLKQCQPSPDLPYWWECGVHDKDLLIGAAKHGLSKTDEHILHDPKLIFIEMVHKYGSTRTKYSRDHSVRETRSTNLSSQNTEDISNASPSLPNGHIDQYKISKPSIKEGEDVTNPTKVNGDVVESSDDETVKDFSMAPDEPEAKSEPEVKAKCDAKLDSAAKSASSETGGKEKDKKSNQAMEVDQMNSSGGKGANEGDSCIKQQDNKAEIIKDDETETPMKCEDSERADSVKKECDDVLANGRYAAKKDESVKQVASDAADDVAKEQEVDAKHSSKDNTEDECVIARMSSAGDETCDKKDKTDIDKEKLDDHMKESMNADTEDETTEVKKCTKVITSGDVIDKNDPVMQDYIARMAASGAGVQWPKDRVIFHRLEHVALCIEKGEWPQYRSYSYITRAEHMSDSRSSTPVPPGTPSDAASTPLHVLDYTSSGTPDPAVSHDALYGLESDSGRMSGYKKRRHRRTKAEVEAEKAEKALKMKEMLVACMGVGDDGEPNLANVHRLALESGLHNGTLTSSPAKPDGEVDHSIIEQQVQMFMPQKKRRGRKRKIDKILEAAQAVAAEKMAQAQLAAVEAAMSKPPKPSTTEAHVPVINLEDGSRLSGDNAPLASELDKWLEDHPGYIAEKDMHKEEVLLAAQKQAELVAQQQHQRLLAHHAMLASQSASAVASRTNSRGIDETSRKRKSKLNPASAMEGGNVDSEENIPVIHRETGKRITGAKAPPLKHLVDWLEHNPGYEVDPKWVPLVKRKGSSADTMMYKYPQESREKRERVSDRGETRSHREAQAYLDSQHNFREPLQERELKEHLTERKRHDTSNKRHDNRDLIDAHERRDMKEHHHDSREYHIKERRASKEQRDVRESPNAKPEHYDVKEHRDAREHHDIREHRDGKEIHNSRDNVEHRDGRRAKSGKDTRDREHRDRRNSKGEGKDSRGRLSQSLLQDSPSASTSAASGSNPYAAALGGMSAAEYQQYAASMAAFSSMGMPFGGLASMGMNPMYMASLGMLPGMAGMTGMPGVDDDDNADVPSKKSGGNSKDDRESLATSSHQAFSPFMYNPMMFNPLFAQSLGMSSGLPASYASLMSAHAAASMSNGISMDSSVEEGEVTHSKPKNSSSSGKSSSVSKDRPKKRPDGRKSHEPKRRGIDDLAQDLSMRKRSRKLTEEQEQGLDLSVKPKGDK